MIKVSGLAAKIKEIGEANPDVKYEDIEFNLSGEAGAECQYQINGTPACIVGRALSELGVGIETLKEFDNLLGNGSESIPTVVRKRPDLFELDSYIAMEFAQAAQEKQDAGSTWGLSVHQ